MIKSSFRSILPFSGFFGHHVAHDWSHEQAKKIQPRIRSAPWVHPPLRAMCPRVQPLRAVHPVLEFSHCGNMSSSSSCVQPLPGGMNLDLIHCLRLCALGFSHCCGLRALGLHPLLQAAYARVHPLCALESILPSSATAAGDVPSKFVHCCGPVPLQSHCSAARPTG